MKRIAAALVAVLAGCNMVPNNNPGGGGNGNPSPCAQPAGLPIGGYLLLYDIKTTDNADGESSIQEGLTFECNTTPSASGFSGEYCGFHVEGTETGFTFDTVADSNVWGEFKISGTGDEEGAYIKAEFIYPDFGIDAYDEYFITHTGVF